MVIIYVLIGIVIILGIPFLRFAARGAHLAENRFACPNCGHHFYAKWYQVMFAGGMIHLYNYAKLKCPKCKVTDACGIPPN